MKHILGCMRRAIEDFDMIDDGDRIAVGISGGKDSIALLKAMRLYQYYGLKKYDLVAITIDLGLDGGMDLTPVQALCDEWEIPYVVKKTNIAKVVFEGRQEKNPCSLCAKMRRGALHDACHEMNCNKIALGHHRDDALQTFMLSLLYEGRISTFSPLTWMDRADITQIRPMIYVPEKEIISAVRRYDLPVTKNPCPADGHTKRDDMRDLIKHFQTVADDPEKYMLLALKKTNTYNLWDKVKRKPKE